MTNDTKAPLLDASHDAYVRLMAAARLSKPHNGYGEADIVSDELTLRSHITAQAEKISALEKKLSEQIREDEMRLINHCVKIVGNNSKAHIHAEAEFLTRIAELEAENKRLREALDKLARLGGSNGEYGNSIGNQIAQAALAQTGGK